MHLATRIQSEEEVQAHGQTSCPQEFDDLEVVRRVLAGEEELYEIIMRRYNQRLFRVALSILGSPAEAEDVIQEAYFKAYCKLGQFEGRAAFSTWLTKIAVYEALDRKRRSFRDVGLDSKTEFEKQALMPSSDATPEKGTLQSELAHVLEQAIVRMPENYRTVFVLRQIEALSTRETAELLDLSEALVKTQLHRARRWLQKRLLEDLEASRREVLQFAGRSCDRVVERVLTRIAAQRTRSRP